MKVTFLGYKQAGDDTKTGNTCSVLLQAEEYDIILDAGNGLAKRTAISPRINLYTFSSAIFTLTT